VEKQKQFDIKPEAFEELSTLIDQTDMNSFKQYIQSLKDGVIELTQPLVLE
jgi:hypothetical protein